jgi:GntR family transcriptional repressor for pyruvate dehydrogenase complex
MADASGASQDGRAVGNARGHPSRALPVSRLRPAYEQVADQLRELILEGELRADEYLPTEQELCALFGTSRSTIREALRVLGSENLIVVRRGARGGANVSRPSPEHLVDHLTTTLTLLARTGELAPEELLEARKLLEVPAAGMAAGTWGQTMTNEIEPFVSDRVTDLGRQELFDVDHAFHQAILVASGNRLLILLAEPLFQILRRSYLDDPGSERFRHTVLEDHRAISRALAEGDAEQARRQMEQHLDHLAPLYLRTDQAQEGRQASKSGPRLLDVTTRAARGTIETAPTHRRGQLRPRSAREGL